MLQRRRQWACINSCLRLLHNSSSVSRHPVQYVLSHPYPHQPDHAEFQPVLLLPRQPGMPNKCQRCGGLLKGHYRFQSRLHCPPEDVQRELVVTLRDASNNGHNQYAQYAARKLRLSINVPIEGLRRRRGVPEPQEANQLGLLTRGLFKILGFQVALLLLAAIASLAPLVRRFQD